MDLKEALMSLQQQQQQQQLFVQQQLEHKQAAIPYEAATRLHE